MRPSPRQSPGTLSVTQTPNSPRRSSSRSSRMRDGGPVNDAGTEPLPATSSTNWPASPGGNWTRTGTGTLSMTSWSRLRAYSQTRKARTTETAALVSRSNMSGHPDQLPQPLSQLLARHRLQLAADRQRHPPRLLADHQQDRV